jgi:hypothetical protein
MASQDDEQHYQVLARLSLLALYILMGADIVIVLAGYFIDKGVNRSIVAEPVMIRNVLFLIAICELAAMHFIKRSMLAKVATRGSAAPAAGKEVPYAILVNITLVMTAMCSAISIYGLVALMLGSRFEVLMLFVAISLIGYQLFRLRPRDFRNE